MELWVEDAGSVRIDRWLAEHLSDLSRSRIQKLIEQQAVFVNEHPCVSKKAELRSGDQVRIDIPAPVPLDLLPEAIPLSILYEDDALLIVDKPAGMVVHPAPGHSSGTLVNAVLYHCGSALTGVGGVARPGIVHRLDKDTTGAMVVAKTETALHHLQDQIRAKTARREYLALVYGAPSLSSGTVDQPIGRHPKDRKKMAVVPLEKGRRAVTHWQLRERLGNYSLLHYQLETGRTHQIRVHSAFMRHPIIGDETYGAGRSLGVKLSGQALHARRLTLCHPISGDTIIAEAPLPSDFAKLLDRLRRRC
ncbi:MAG: RluA family pseudouridine synthase [Cyanobacteria bacterium J06632_22]